MTSINAIAEAYSRVYISENAEDAFDTAKSEVAQLGITKKTPVRTILKRLRNGEIVINQEATPGLYNLAQILSKIPSFRSLLSKIMRNRSQTNEAYFNENKIIMDGNGPGIIITLILILIVLFFVDFGSFISTLGELISGGADAALEAASEVEAVEKLGEIMSDADDSMTAADAPELDDPQNPSDGGSQDSPPTPEPQADPPADDSYDQDDPESIADRWIEGQEFASEVRQASTEALQEMAKDESLPQWKQEMIERELVLRGAELVARESFDPYEYLETHYS